MPTPINHSFKFPRLTHNISKFSLRASKLLFISSLAIPLSTPLAATNIEEILSGRGAWLQSPRKFSNSSILAIKDLGITRTHVMITHAPKTVHDCKKANLPELTASPQKLIDIISNLKSSGITAIATVYLPPTRNAIDNITNTNNGILKLLVDSGADAIEYDLEGGWSKSVPCGFSTHADAVDYLIATTKNIKSLIPVGITTHLGRANDPKVGLSKADWISIQSYSKCNKSENDCVEFNDPQNGPGFKQTRTPDALKNYDKPVLIGLAAYFQKWPNRTIEEAMSTSLTATEKIISSNKKFIGYSYWSTSWILDKDTEQYKFLIKTAKQKSAQEQKASNN